MKFTMETARRAGRTFVQAFLAYVVVNVAIIDFSAEKAVLKSALIGLAISAVSAGLAAVMNLEVKKDDADM